MAVYTHLSDSDISGFLESYAIGRLISAQGITAGVENSNYLLTTENNGQRQRYILTLYEKRVSTDNLPFFLGLMKHLAQRGISCPLPVHLKSGEMFSQLGGKPAAIVTFLEGKSIDAPDIAHISMLGKALAQMHLVAVDGFSLMRPNDLSPFRLKPLYDQVADGLDSIRPGLGGEMGEEVEFWNNHAGFDIPQGIVHADLFPDNVFFKDGRLSGIIDYYFSCRDYLMYDLAVCVNSWCFDNNCESDGKKIDALLQSYEIVRTIGKNELDALPLLCRGAALRFLLTRSYDYLNQMANAQVRVKDPMEYVRKWEHWKLK